MNVKIKGTEKETFISMLEAMEKCRIFYIAKENSGDFTIQECCDNYFDVVITKDQLKQLGEEIIAFSNT